MKFLMLRGQLPQDRDPQEIVFDRLEDVCDMWTQLFFAMLSKDDQGELYYWGGNRKHNFSVNFIERWVPYFETYNTKFVPDVIFCRGGFKEYHPVLERFPKAIKLYYGAGNRFLPQPGFHDYDIILQDSPEQVYICEQKFPKALTTLYIKPAADNIFYPHDCEKEFDVCFPANAAQPFKGHDFVYSTVPKHIKLLNLGNRQGRFPHPSNVTSFRVLRSDMAKNISRCKMGIIAVSSKVDSCPRVIPELLACDIPIVVLEDVGFWQEKYIRSIVQADPFNIADGSLCTGELASRDSFWEMVELVLTNLKTYSPRKYYEENLSLDHAAKFLRRKIDERITYNNI